MTDQIDVPAAASPELVVVVLATRDGQRLERCLRSLAGACDGLLAQAVVCANASAPDVLAVIDRARGAVVMRSTVNLGTSATWNRAVQAHPAPRFAIVHEDAEPEPGCFRALMTTLDDRPDASVVGPYQLTTDGEVVHNQGWVQWRDGVPWPIGPTSAPELELPDEPFPVDFVSSATMVVDRVAWEALDGFDEGSFPAVTSEIDLCTAAWALGRQVLVDPTARARHSTGAMVAPDSGWDASPAFRRFLIDTNVARYLRRWERALEDHLPTPAAMPDTAAVQMALERVGAAAASSTRPVQPLPPRERPITAGAPPELDAPAEVEARAVAFMEQRRTEFLDWLVANHEHLTAELERVVAFAKDVDARLHSTTQEQVAAEARLAAVQAELDRRSATLTWRLRDQVLRVPGVARSTGALRRAGRRMS